MAVVLQKSIIKFFKEFENSSRPGMLLNLTRSCIELQVTPKRMFCIAEEYSLENNNLVLIENGLRKYLRRI
jgi:hypothetical protein